jgi:hypothetical protein
MVADGAEHRPDESAVSVRADHQCVASSNALEQHLGGVSFHRLLRDSDRIRRALRVGFCGLLTAASSNIFTEATASANSCGGPPSSGT